LTVFTPSYRSTHNGDDAPQIDVTAIATTVVLYVVYYKNLPLILFNGEGKITLQQVMMTYTDRRKTSPFLFSLTAKCGWMSNTTHRSTPQRVHKSSL